MRSGSVSNAAQHQEALKRRHHPARRLLHKRKPLLVLRLRADQRPAQPVRVAVEILGGRVHHNIRAQRQRTLQHRRQKSIVHADLDAVRVRNPAHRRQYRSKPSADCWASQCESAWSSAVSPLPPPSDRSYPHTRSRCRSRKRSGRRAAPSRHKHPCEQIRWSPARSIATSAEMAAIPLVNAWPLMPALKRRQSLFQPVPRGVSGARVVPAPVRADAGQLKSRRKVNRHIHSARLRVRILPGMNGKGRVFVGGRFHLSRCKLLSSSLSQQNERE